MNTWSINNSLVIIMDRLINGEGTVYIRDHVLMIEDGVVELTQQEETDLRIVGVKERIITTRAEADESSLP